MSRTLLLAGASALAILVAASAVGAATFSMPGAYIFKVAVTGEYSIDIVGASGGSNFTVNLPGGLGAELSGDIQLNAGDELTLHVGGHGQDVGGYQNPAGGGAGGGGGSFIRALGAAGGGGGAGSAEARGAGMKGSAGGAGAGPAGARASMETAEAAEPSLPAAMAATLPITAAPAAATGATAREAIPDLARNFPKPGAEAQPAARAALPAEEAAVSPAAAGAATEVAEEGAMAAAGEAAAPISRAFLRTRNISAA